MALVVLGLAAGGCYTYQPLAAAPHAGLDVALVLTDQARIDLADRIGPNAARVEGVLVQAADSAYVVAMREVFNDRGIRFRWTGEQVELHQSYIRVPLERRLSKSRTLLLVGAALALGATILTTDLVGIGGTGDDDGGRGPDPVEQNRVPYFNILRLSLP